MNFGKLSGFTLLEMMVVVAIVAILAAIAIPNYSEYIKRGERGDAQTYILSLAQNLESYRLVNHSFFGADITQLGGNKFPQTGGQNYQLTLTDISGKSFNDASANLQSWLIVAKPVTGSRLKGTGVISLDSTGTKCWYKNNDNANVTSTVDKNGNAVPATECPNQWKDR